jgi:hypothetical protein
MVRETVHAGSTYHGHKGHFIRSDFGMFDDEESVTRR